MKQAASNIFTKIMRKIFFTILILLLLGFIFRGAIYRALITYHSVGQRINYTITKQKFIDVIAQKENKLDINDITKFALSITSDNLRFTDSKNDVDPNLLIESKTAHCVGYASFYAATCNYLLKKHELDNRWIARPEIGKLYFLGVNVHDYFNTSFMKDHDFVTLENKETREIMAIDPTLSDYLYIDYVTYKRESTQVD